MSTASLLDRAEYLAFIQAIIHSTVGIAVQRNTIIGTGTLVSFRERRFVLTAAHVINGADLSEIRFFVPPSAVVKEHSMLEGVPSNFALTFAGDLFPVDGAALVDKKNDLAAIPLRDTALIPSYMRAFPIEQALDGVGDNTSVVVVGFPVDNSADYEGENIYQGKWKALGLTTEHVVFSSTLQTRYSLHSSFDPNRHFVIEYSRVDDGITPPGFSGAVAWCGDMPAASVWTARPVLSGIIASWHKKTCDHPHLLQGTKGYLVKQLFEKSLRESQ